MGRSRGCYQGYIKLGSPPDILHVSELVEYLPALPSYMVSKMNETSCLPSWNLWLVRETDILADNYITW